MQNKRLSKLHAIRGWAALMVVIAHAKWPFWSGGNEYLAKYPMEDWSYWEYPIFALDMLTSPASIYVIIFYVLSGFFIAKSLLDNKYDIYQFYLFRFIRVYSPLLGSMLLAFLLINLSIKINPDFFSEENTYIKDYAILVIKAANELSFESFFNTLIINPTGESGFFGFGYPYWSLYYELIFYITIPFLARKYLFISLAIIASILLNNLPTQWLSINSYLIHYALYFASGFFLYELIYYRNVSPLPKKTTNIVILMSFSLLIAALYVGILKYDKYLSYELAMLSGFSFIYWIVLGHETRVYRFFINLLANRLSNFLGKISFSLYLTHVPLFILMYTLLNIYTDETIYYERLYWIAVFLVIPLSYLCYLVFEKPSLVLLRHLKEALIKS